MTHRGPFQPLPCCDSVILFLLWNSNVFVGTFKGKGIIWCPSSHSFLSSFVSSFLKCRIFKSVFELHEFRSGMCLLHVAYLLRERWHFIVAACDLQATDCRLCGRNFTAQMLEGKIHHRCVGKCGTYSTLHTQTVFPAEPPVAAALKWLLFPPATYSPKEKV